jgi:hypothetical protein
MLLLDAAVRSGCVLRTQILSGPIFKNTSLTRLRKMRSKFENGLAKQKLPYFLLKI